MKRILNIIVTTMIVIAIGVLLYLLNDGLVDQFSMFYKKDHSVSITRLLVDNIQFWWVMVIFYIAICYHPIVFSKGKYQYMSLLYSVISLISIFVALYLPAFMDPIDI